MNITREDGLLAWQWSNYLPAHRDRHNLAVHALTVPLFILGTCSVLLGICAVLRWSGANVNREVFSAEKKERKDATLGERKCRQRR
jgi:hypothetical protein